MYKSKKKYNKVPIETKNLIVKDYDSKKWSLNMLSKKYNLHRSTIYKIIKLYKQRGYNERKVGSGRPKNLNLLTEIERLRLENKILKKFQAFLNQQQEQK